MQLTNKVKDVNSKQKVRSKAQRFSCFNPIQTGLFEGFLTIVRKLKDIAVKGGFFNDQKWILKHHYILSED